MSWSPFSRSCPAPARSRAFALGEDYETEDTTPYQGPSTYGICDPGFHRDLDPSSPNFTYCVPDSQSKGGPGGIACGYGFSYDFSEGGCVSDSWGLPCDAGAGTIAKDGSCSSSGYAPVEGSACVTIAGWEGTYKAGTCIANNAGAACEELDVDDTIGIGTRDDTGECVPTKWKCPADKGPYKGFCVPVGEPCETLEGAEGVITPYGCKPKKAAAQKGAPAPGAPAPGSPSTQTLPGPSAQNRPPGAPSETPQGSALPGDRHRMLTWIIGGAAAGGVLALLYTSTSD